MKTPYLTNFPTNIEITESTADVTTQIAPIHAQNGVGYIEIKSDFSLNNQLLFSKNNECNQLNIELKSAMAQMPNTKSAKRTIVPDQTSARPIGLRPHNTNNKIQNKTAPNVQMPNAIRTFAKNDRTSSK